MEVCAVGSNAPTATVAFDCGKTIIRVVICLQRKQYVSDKSIHNPHISYLKIINK